jgi:hypothetical protein
MAQCGGESRRWAGYGWAEIHPVARGVIPMNILMVFAPRDDEEILKLVETSRTRAIPETSR